MRAAVRERAGAPPPAGRRTRAGGRLVLAAGNLVGVAFDPSGGVVVASNDTAYRLDPGAVASGRPELL